MVLSRTEIWVMGQKAVLSRLGMWVMGQKAVLSRIEMWILGQKAGLSKPLVSPNLTVNVGDETKAWSLKT